MTPLRRIAKAIGAILCIPLLYILAGLAGAIIPGPVAPVSPTQGPLTRIGLLGGPIHYDLILPLTPQIRTAFAFADSAGVPISDPNAEWLIVGWGAEGFYTATDLASDLTRPILWHAVTGDNSVLRLDVAGPVVDDTGITYTDIDAGHIDALTAAILASFARDTKGQPRPLPRPGFTATDRFFAAKGRFDALHTCNTWIGQTLRKAGVPFGIWTPLPQSVWLSATWHGLDAGR